MSLDKNIKFNKTNNETKDTNNLYSKMLIDESYRYKTIDWIYKINISLNNEIQTFYRSVDIFDLYIGLNSITSKKKLKLIASLCIYISSKMTEIKPLNLDYLNKIIFKYQYPILFLKKMKKEILKSINYNLTRNLLIDWTSKILFWNKFNQNIIKKSNYIFNKLVIYNLSILRNYTKIEISIAIIYLILKLNKFEFNKIIYILIKENEIKKHNIFDLIQLLLNQINQTYNYNLIN